MKNLFYKTISWIAKHLPDVIAIPIGEWLKKELQKERRKRKLKGKRRLKGNKKWKKTMQWEKQCKKYGWKKK